MEAVGGDVSLHDHEYDDVAWFPLPDALAHLTYANEVEILRLAAPESPPASPPPTTRHTSPRARSRNTADTICSEAAQAAFVAAGA